MDKNLISNKRSYYIDNLRGTILLFLIPYHTSMAWNVWGESNYIFFGGNKVISSIVVFFSPFFMPVMFLLSGISTRYSLKKRTMRGYIKERVKRLLLPMVFGTIVFMPVMTYLADKFNYSYNGGFIGHYVDFFTKYTDLSGADGGFSFGQFWFLLYLFIISLINVGATYIFKNIPQRTFSFWQIIAFGIPLPLISELLSIGGKSLAEYAFLFLT